MCCSVQILDTHIVPGETLYLADLEDGGLLLPTANDNVTLTVRPALVHTRRLVLFGRAWHQNYFCVVEKAPPGTQVEANNTAAGVEVRVSGTPGAPAAVVAGDVEACGSVLHVINKVSLLRALPQAWPAQRECWACSCQWPWPVALIVVLLPLPLFPRLSHAHLH